MAFEQDRHMSQSDHATKLRDVVIRDCTLREAEQAVGLTLDEKIHIAQKLSDAGVARIQIGAPGRSSIDQEAAIRLKTDGIDATLDAIAIAYVSDWKDHIDACARCGVDAVDLVHPISPIHLERVLQIDQQRMLERLKQAVTYARRCGISKVTVSAMDAPRASMAVLRQVAQTIHEAGASELIICDSVGVSGPQWISHMVRNLGNNKGLRIGIHCHNDLGLALANTLAAIDGGATMADVTINGLGERAGNVCLDELVVSLKALYHKDTGIDTARLMELALSVSQITEVALPFNKPLVGKQAFTHRHDTHARAAVAEPKSIEPIDPTLVGNKRAFLAGKYSGPLVINLIAKRLGLTLTDQQADQLAMQVRQFSTEHKQPISDEQFIQMARDVALKSSESKATL